MAAEDDETPSPPSHGGRRSHRLLRHASLCGRCGDGCCPLLRHRLLLRHPGRLVHHPALTQSTCTITDRPSALLGSRGRALPAPPPPPRFTAGRLAARPPRQTRAEQTARRRPIAAGPSLPTASVSRALLCIILRSPLLLPQRGAVGGDRLRMPRRTVQGVVAVAEPRSERPDRQGNAQSANDVTPISPAAVLPDQERPESRPNPSTMFPKGSTMPGGSI